MRERGRGEAKGKSGAPPKPGVIGGDKMDSESSA